MKKVLVLASAVLFGTSAFSQDVFKQISKIKDYNEALNLVKSNLGSLSAEEKAKCYNALVDLSYAKVVKEQATMSENQLNLQLKKEVTPLDSVGLYNAVLTAMEDGAKCDEFDNQPNAKGKVKPKFHKPNADRLYPLRYHLINAGIYYQGKSNDELAGKFLAAYVETNDYPLFNEQDKSKDANLGQMAYFAGLYAYRAKDYAKAEKYVDVALNDTTYAKDAMNIKLAVMQSQLKSHSDSLEYVNKLKGIYVKDNSNEAIFSTLCSMLMATDQKAELDNLLNEKLKTDPNNVTVLLMQGQSLYNDRKYDEAIEKFTKALESQPQNVPVTAMVGQCYMYKAQDAANRAAGKTGRIAPAAEKVIIDVYKQAIEYFEKAKDLDITMENKNYWAYPLYNCVYRIYGPDDPKTKEYENLK